MPKLFLTGATGLVGGQVLHELGQRYSDFDVTALVRSDDRVAEIAGLYPRVNVVVGGLDDVEIIEREAANASIVMNLASNKHVVGAKAIHQGLSKRGSTSYWIQISGASLLASAEIASPSYEPGSPSSSIYDDLNGADDIRSLIKAHPVREIDNYLLDVSKSTPLIKTALVFPPIIYGKGEGPGNKHSIQIPSLARVTLEGGQAVQVGPGLSRWGSIHVKDLAKMILAIGEEAAKGNEDDSLWGNNGIYLASAADVSFGDVSSWVSQTALENGWITNSSIRQLSKEEAGKLLPGGFVFFGTNCIGHTHRAKTLLKWKPEECSLVEDVPQAVACEAAKRG